MKAPSLIAALCLLASVAHGQERESLRLRITNAPGGAVEASTDAGATWQRLGSVVLPADRVNPASYTAAGWAQDSSIAATAVNAIHIKVAANPQTGRPMTISIVPGGEIIGAANRQRSSAIVTDIPGGTSIFGGGLGPYVNSPVCLEGPSSTASRSVTAPTPVPSSNQMTSLYEGSPADASIRRPTDRPLPPDYRPAEGDVLLIIRHEPSRLPRTATFENRAGGAVTVDYGEGPVQVGVVDRPVTGIGRFEGGLYSWPGRIRANHPGVIDVSTAPHGMIGGFQIIPRTHAESPELAYTKTGHQWLIIGPDEPGTPPFFSGTILPSYRRDDVTGDYADWVERLWSRTMVQVRYGDGPWELMPRIAFSDKAAASNADASDRGRQRLWLIPAPPRGGGKLEAEARELANHALDGVTHLRIVFPLMTFAPPGRSP